MKKIIFLIILILLLGITLAEEFYPTTIGSLDTTIRLHGYGSISGLKEGEEITFQTLTFQESEFQETRVIKENVYINGKTILPEYILDEFGNKYVKFTIPYNGDFNYELIANIKTNALINQIKDYQIGAVGEKQQIYVEQTEKIESESSEILTVANNKLTSTGFVETLNETIFWVNDYVSYAQGNEFQKYYLLQKSALETLLEKKGVCDEFSNLGAALLRAKNIPTRLAIGLSFDGREWGNHAWLEVYHKDLGWIPSDPTFREPGFVDATHIKIGSFSDVSLSLAKAIFPSTANVLFQTQTIPEVTINNKAYFDMVDLSINTIELKANQWNEIELNVRNKTNSDLTVPIKIRESYSDILIEDTSKSTLLTPNESKKVIFKMYPIINLDSGEIAKGTISFNSLSEPLNVEFIITPSPEVDNGTVVVKDVTPISNQGKLLLIFTIANNSSNESQVDMNLVKGQEVWNWTETIPPFTETEIKKEVDLENTTYFLTIETKNEIYSQSIVPAIQKAQIDNTPKQTSVVQKIDEGLDETLIDYLIKNPWLIIFGLLIVFAVLLLLVFASKRKYV